MQDAFTVLVMLSGIASGALLVRALRARWKEKRDLDATLRANAERTAEANLLMLKHINGALQACAGNANAMAELASLAWSAADALAGLLVTRGTVPLDDVYGLRQRMAAEVERIKAVQTAALQRLEAAMQADLAAAAQVAQHRRT